MSYLYTQHIHIADYRRSYVLLIGSYIVIMSPFIPHSLQNIQSTRRYAGYQEMQLNASVNNDIIVTESCHRDVRMFLHNF